MKKFLALSLAILMILMLCACSTTGSSSSNSTDYSTMEPEEAAQEAADSTQDKTSISDIVRVPFGYVMEWLYEFTKNYGLALILFSFLVKLILLPMSVKSKKSMLKMTRLAPEVKALEAKYGDDKQKYQLAVQNLYKEEGVSTTGGCAWSIIPLLILLPLYYVIREPITYMLHNSRSISAAIVAYMQASGVQFGTSTYYQQLTAASHIGEFVDQLKNFALTASANLKEIDFSFLGLNLADIPTWRVWNCKGWAQIGLFLVPLVSAGIQMVSMLMSQKMNNAVATDKNGEVDDAAAKTNNQTTMTMMIMMPVMTLWIGYSMPAAISIYWIAQAFFGIPQELLLNKYCKKAYEAEDAERRARAAARAAEEAEKERIRAERRAANPDGFTDNTSKKKLKAREKAEQKLNIEGKLTPEEREALHKAKPALSGDPDRPNAKGRAYVADRYAKDGTELVPEDAEAPAYDDDAEEEAPANELPEVTEGETAAEKPAEGAAEASADEN